MGPVRKAIYDGESPDAFGANTDHDVEPALATLEGMAWLSPAGNRAFGGCLPDRDLMEERVHSASRSPR